MNWLTRIPFIGTAFSWIFGNVRLAIEYALIALVIAAAAVAVSLWYRTNYLEEANGTLHSRIAGAEAVNEIQDATIQDLKSLREQDQTALEGLSSDYRTLSKSDAAARRRLATLEKENAAVRNYLDQPLVPELACLLNAKCAANASAASAGKTAGKPAGGVSGAGGTQHRDKPRPN